MSNRKIAFFDRDGVINRKAAEHYYVTQVADFAFNEGFFEVLGWVFDHGFTPVVITNQRGVARGLMSEARLQEIHAHMNAQLVARGLPALRVFYCPHERETCVCRKPAPGLIKAVQQEFGITDLSDSILISDAEAEIIMGKNCGIGYNFLVESDIGMRVLLPRLQAELL